MYKTFFSWCVYCWEKLKVHFNYIFSSSFQNNVGVSCLGVSWNNFFTKPAFIQSKYIKNSNKVKYYKYFLFEYIFLCNLFLWCKAEFSASLLQSSVSHYSSRNHSNMLIYCSRNSMIIIIKINVENTNAYKVQKNRIYLYNYFVTLEMPSLF